MRKRISIPQLILLVLERVVEGGELILQSSEDLRKWMYEVYSDYPQQPTKYYLSRAIKRLRQRGLIEAEQKRTQELVLRLTQKGKQITFLTSEKESRWDGKWRVVVFDIPENKREVRDILRWRLKHWGFIPWQKSVWASKRNLTVKLREFIKEIGIEGWVMVLESDNVGF